MRLCRILLTGGIPRQCLAVQQYKFFCGYSVILTRYSLITPNETLLRGWSARYRLTHY